MHPFHYQGYYQAARQLLNEAFLASKAFGDKQTEAHILQNLAYLACQEGSYGLAINMLKEAQVRSAGQTRESNMGCFVLTYLLCYNGFQRDNGPYSQKQTNFSPGLNLD